MPGPERPAPGPLAELVSELQLLYRAAGRPAYRRISLAIHERNNDMPDTVSHETVGAILRGEGLSKWTKVECLVRQLATMAVHHPDPEEEVRRFHTYWLAADDLLRTRGVSITPDVQDHHESTTAEPEVPAQAWPPPSTAQLSGSIPYRNPGFTGRESLLDLIGARLTGQPWQPLILHGLGGVGKTRLALEYAHRQAVRYDLVWWIAAEQPPMARTSLAGLGERLDVPPSMDMQQTVRLVLNRLESAAERWLLVFDNAGPPEEIKPLVPAAGGHVIVTTRDPAWRSQGRAVDVDVFSRSESIELLRNRGHGISFDEADQIAHLLGDLPLALEQVAAMQSATRIPAAEYLRQLNARAPAVLAGGQPSDYPMPVASAFGVAFDRLRRESPVAAQLLELLSCLGAEPVSLALLRSAGGGDIAPPLGRILDQPAPLDEAVRRLRRYGLVKVDDTGQRIQVHRLVQVIVRDTLDTAVREQAYANAHRLLAAANPGDPDDPLTWELHSEIGPHVMPCGLIDDTAQDARKVVLDQIRYRYRIGDYDGSSRMGVTALAAWTANEDPNDEQTFVCQRHLAVALRGLGEYERAHGLILDAWQLLRTDDRYGPDDPLTIGTAVNVAALHRVFGRYDEALAIDRDCVERYRRLCGEEDGNTLYALNNLAVSMRMVGDFAAAHETDSALVERRRQLLGPEHHWTLLSTSNLALDLYGLGRYAEALETQRAIWPTLRDRLGSRHDNALLSARTIALALRKTGQLDAALRQSREHYLTCQGRFGPDHAHTLASVMSYANTLRAVGQVPLAWNFATAAVSRYRRRFGERNPLTLAAATNLAIILRAMGEGRKARQIDEASYNALCQELTPDHPYALAAAVGLANDLVIGHEDGAAKNLLERTLAEARRVRGDEHPDTLTCQINLGLAMQTGGGAGGPELVDSAAAALRRALGPDHPLVVAAGHGQRGECDIEPPPT